MVSNKKTKILKLFVKRLEETESQTLQENREHY